MPLLRMSKKKKKKNGAKTLTHATTAHEFLAVIELQPLGLQFSPLSTELWRHTLIKFIQVLQLVSVLCVDPDFVGHDSTA